MKTGTSHILWEWAAPLILAAFTAPNNIAK